MGYNWPCLGATDPSYTPGGDHNEQQLTSEEHESMDTYGHDTYLSPLTWRYGSEEMRIVWSEVEKRRLLAPLLGRTGRGAVRGRASFRPEQVDDLRAHVEDVDVARATEIEREIRHDLMAEIRTFAEQCPVGGRDHPSGRHFDGCAGQCGRHAHATRARR